MAEATSDRGATNARYQKKKSTGARAGERCRANAVLAVLQLVTSRDTNLINSAGGIRFKAGVAGRGNTQPGESQVAVTPAAKSSWASHAAVTQTAESLGWLLDRLSRLSIRRHTGTNMQRLRSALKFHKIPLKFKKWLSSMIRGRRASGSC